MKSFKQFSEGVYSTSNIPLSKITSFLKMQIEEILKMDDDIAVDRFKYLLHSQVTAHLSTQMDKLVKSRTGSDNIIDAANYILVEIDSMTPSNRSKLKKLIKDWAYYLKEVEKSILTHHIDLHKLTKEEEDLRLKTIRKQKSLIDKQYSDLSKIFSRWDKV